MYYATRDKENSIFADSVVIWRTEPRLGTTMWHSLKIDGWVDTMHVDDFNKLYKVKLNYGEKWDIST